MFWSAVHYLCLCAWITCMVMFIINPKEPLASYFLIGSMVASVLTWIWAFFKRRAARCPLCKGTPLLNSGALPHGRAVRVPPFNYGVTATLSLLCTQEFRCMYCGSLYDLLKPPPSTKPPAPAPDSERQP